MIILYIKIPTYLKKGQFLEKKIDQPLISNILQEIIQEGKLDKNALEEAEELNKKITLGEGKGEKDDVNIIFLDDYLDFLEKYCRVKI